MSFLVVTIFLWLTKQKGINLMNKFKKHIIFKILIEWIGSITWVKNLANLNLSFKRFTNQFNSSTLEKLTRLSVGFDYIEIYRIGGLKVLTWKQAPLSLLHNKTNNSNPTYHFFIHLSYPLVSELAPLLFLSVLSGRVS